MKHGRQDLIEIVLPVLEAGGYELADLTLAMSGRPIIRLYVHSPGGITIDDCTRISRAVEFELDSADIYGRRYHLEVSSPGLDRPLKTEKDFARNIGKEAKLFLQGEGEDITECLGTIRSCSSDGLVLDVGGEDNILAWDKIISGKLVF